MSEEYSQPPHADTLLNVKKPKERESKMTDNDAWLLQISLKTPRGAMINIRAVSAEALANNLNTIRDMAADILEAEAELFGTGNMQNLGQQLGATPIQQAPSFTPQQGPPPSFAQPAQGNSPVCQHNMPAKYVQGGISKTGRPYKAFWACAMPREQQCSFRAEG